MENGLGNINMLDMKEHKKGVQITVKVRTGSDMFFLHPDGRLELKSLPQKGKANTEIIKGLSKLFGCDVKIIKGIKSKEKIILLIGANLPILKEKLKYSIIQ